MTLPEPAPPKLVSILEKLDEETGALLTQRVLGSTPAEAIAAALRRNGHEISATTLRTYRRSIKTKDGV